MSNGDFNSSLKAKLKKLFSEYESKFKIQAQRNILKEGFVYSQIDSTAEILIMGINPSLRTDFVNVDSYSYNYAELEGDRYFKKFSVLLKDFKNYGITYCDLFYQRHTEQKQIEYFLKDEIGRAFLRDQLTITRDVIQYISPKLILLFNRKGAQFFSTEWINLELQMHHSKLVSSKTNDDLFRIKEFSTLLYLSAFLGYRTPRKTFENLSSDLLILKEIIKTE